MKSQTQIRALIKWRYFAAILFFLLAMLVPPATAAMQCAPVNYLVNALNQQGEKPKWRGVANKNLVMLMTHPMTQKWTILAINPLGIGCIVLHGDGSEAIQVSVPISPIPRNDR
jgi:hypothetical protein